MTNSMTEKEEGITLTLDQEQEDRKLGILRADPDRSRLPKLTVFLFNKSGGNISIVISSLTYDELEAMVQPKEGRVKFNATDDSGEKIIVNLTEEVVAGYVIMKTPPKQPMPMPFPPNMRPMQ